MPYLVEEDDLFQEVMLRALHAAEQFQGSTAEELRGWIRTIARRCQIDRLREIGARPKMQTLEESLQADPGNSGPEPVLQKEELTRVLSSLSSLEQALLRARYEGGLSFQQIGRVLEKSPVAVRQMHHRLLKELRLRLGVGGQ